MVTVHLIVGVAVLVTNLAAGAWGGYSWWRERPTVGFWYLLRVAQALVVLQVMVGSILVLSGHQAIEDLHYVYGVLPLAVTLLAEAARAGAAERELTGLDFDALPTRPPASDRGGDQPAGDRDHVGLGPGRLPAGPARRRDQQRPLLKRS